jgi:hypothetical protein
LFPVLLNLSLDHIGFDRVSLCVGSLPEGIQFVERRLNRALGALIRAIFWVFLFSCRLNSSIVTHPIMKMSVSTPAVSGSVISVVASATSQFRRILDTEATESVHTADSDNHPAE